MFNHEFYKQRLFYSIAAALPLTGLSCIPLLLIPSMGFFRLIFLVFLFFTYSSMVKSIINRALVEDQRYHPSFKSGTYVRICRLPFDFEMTELMVNKTREYEFWEFSIGHITSSDGVFVWIDVGDQYIPTHINCLELLPENYIQSFFEDETEFCEVIPQE